MSSSARSEDAAEVRRAELLEPALRAVYGPDTEVLSLNLALGGNSRETWVAELAPSAGPEKVVLRCDPDDWIRPAEMTREVAGLRLAESADVPAPRVIVASDEVGLGRPYVVTEFIAGTAIPRKILRDSRFAAARSMFARQCGEILAKLHAAGEFADGWECRDPIEDLEARYAETSHPSPILAGSLNWLIRNRPKQAEPGSPVHGDFRLGNLMIGESGIQAVLDWETCHQCDPYEDLGWLCSRAWRYGSHLPVGGLGELDSLLDSYREHLKREIDHDRLSWWLVYGVTSWGLVCNRQGADTADRLNRGAGARLLARQEYNVLKELERYVTR